MAKCHISDTRLSGGGDLEVNRLLTGRIGGFRIQENLDNEIHS
ncbi:MAG: hypothetical protein JWM11_3906 [Planctomycetaceae bacterium]|nr:hypothetical protein [Planctomycetaceae bacterium]